MHAFFVSHISINESTFYLSEEESKHACRVLRLKIDDKIQVLDGKGNDFLCVIKDNNQKKCEVEVISFITEPKPKNEIHIAIAPTKNTDRLEWFLEKSTEIGLTEVSFIICENSERKQIKIDRLEKIIISAMKQSQRKFLPLINNIISFKDFVHKYPKAAIAHCYDGNKKTLTDVYKSNNYPILIGPEGDFSLSEIEFAKMKHYDFITLGKNRLRTETAGIFACVEARLLT
jgi:16S rRNA (uracil1498-N3)-methyltransferase